MEQDHGRCDGGCILDRSDAAASAGLPERSRDYSRSALDRTHRATFELIYDLPFFKNSNWFLKNSVGNWEVAPVYTYESPEYYTVLSGVDSNLNGDGAYIDRTVFNVHGVKGTGSDVTPLTNTNGDTVAYLATNPTAQYITAGSGAMATCP